MKRPERRDLFPGALEMMILQTLKRQPLHGYALAQPIKRTSNDLLIGIIRITGILMGIFGMVALTHSSVGVYGVLSESLAQRTREIGIRIALGAKSRDVMKLLLGQALRLTLIGLLIAVPVAFAVSRLMASVIYGVVSVNFSVLAGFTVLLLLVALVAGYVPARRASRVDPTMALRYE